MDDVQGGHQLAGHGVKLKFDDGVAVLVGYIAFSVGPEAEEAGSLAQTGEESGVLQVPGEGVDTVHGDAVGVAVGNRGDALLKSLGMSE